jgi:hypothetical protein
MAAFLASPGNILRIEEGAMVVTAPGGDLHVKTVNDLNEEVR